MWTRIDAENVFWWVKTSHKCPVKAEPSPLHGIPDLLLLTGLIGTDPAGHLRLVPRLKKSDFVLKLKTILKFCFNTVSSDWAVPQRHYLKDVYDSGMVFYNVFVPRRQAFYTAFKCVCSFPFLLKVLMLILSLLCLRALEGFVLLKIL